MSDKRTSRVRQQSYNYHCDGCNETVVFNFCRNVHNARPPFSILRVIFGYNYLFWYCSTKTDFMREVAVKGQVIAVKGKVSKFMVLFSHNLVKFDGALIPNHQILPKCTTCHKKVHILCCQNCQYPRKTHLRCIPHQCKQYKNQ